MSTEHSGAAGGEQVPIHTSETSEQPTAQPLRAKALRRIEQLFLLSGLILFLMYGCARTHSALMSQAGLWSFESSKSAASVVRADKNHHRRRVDVSLWSGKRVQAYTQAIAGKLATPLAVLSIPRLGIDVPIYEGTDELTLNEGAGRIAGTAEPGKKGNMGIAAHRDGFFRGLKDIKAGDRIELVLTNETLVYGVDGISVVNPNDVSVLRSRSQPSVTLVTCYPFYFVGDAPQRYIVQASLVNSEVANVSEPSEVSKLKKEKTQ